VERLLASGRLGSRLWLLRLGFEFQFWLGLGLRMAILGCLLGGPGLVIWLQSLVVLSFVLPVASVPLLSGLLPLRFSTLLSKFLECVRRARKLPDYSCLDPG
jgi:hypothetical protein